MCQIVFEEELLLRGGGGRGGWAEGAHLIQPTHFREEDNEAQKGNVSSSHCGMVS